LQALTKNRKQVEFSQIPHTVSMHFLLISSVVCY